MQIIFAIVGLLYNGMSTSYATQVKLIPSNVAYFSNGGSLTLTCTVDMDVCITSVLFRRDTFSYVQIINAELSTCQPYKFTSSDTSNYSAICDQQRNFTLMKNGNNATDHRKNWQCVLTSNACSPCRGANSTCTSPVVAAILQVPVTTVQLMNGSAQILSSSVNIVRGQSTDIRCSTAPSGSRPGALFQWYYRQGNQSPVLIVDQSISPTPDPIIVPGQLESDLLISYSTWTLTGNASYHNMYIYCQAQDKTNTGNYTQSSRVQINIVYPPVVQLSPNYSTYTVTEETRNFIFTCNIIESNPSPEANGYNWFHKTSIIQRQTSSSYTLPSVQRTDAGEYMCSARNDYGSGTSNSLVLNVQYPPDLTVMLTGSTMQSQTAMLVCEAKGNPNQTTFYPWVHMWESVPLRTALQGKNNLTHSELTLDRLSLMSMGTYICNASNGISVSNGNLSQTSSSTLRVKGKANILIDNATFVGEIGLSVNVSIPFYSDPAIESFIIQTNGRNIMNTSRTMTYLSKGTVNYQFYNKTIQLDAQKANCMIQNVTSEDFDNYTLVLTNSIGMTSFQFHLDPFGPPLKIQRFYFSRLIDDQIELHFDAGFNGGPEQTFVIEYMSESNFDSVWKNSSVAELRETESQYKLPNGTFFVKVNKPSPGSYIYRMYSWNVKGRSPFSDNIAVTIGVMDNAQNKTPTVEAVAGGVGAAVFVIAVIILVLILLRRGSFLKKKSTADNIDRELINRERPESGLVGNPVYDASGRAPGAASNDIAVVVKPNKNDGLSNLYAQVDRTNRKGKKGDIYENATLPLECSAENVYEDPKLLAEQPSSGENAYENPAASASKGQLVNKDCLLYADVILGPPSTKASKVIIHGLDNRTEYAEIAFGKRGEPLPENDEEKESDGQKKKNCT